MLRCEEISSIPCKTSGVYCFVHVATGMKYVGSSVNIRKRILGHISEVRKGSRKCFHKALRLHGIDAFRLMILELCPRELLLVIEERYIRELNTASALGGFNTREKPTANYGREISEATRERMRLSATGRIMTQATREKKRVAMTGQKRPYIKRGPMPVAVKEKISATKQLKFQKQ